MPIPAMNSMRWAKVLSRWADVEDCGERRLLVALLAAAIDEEARDGGGFDCGFFSVGGNFDAYCVVLGMNPEFVREQIARASMKLAA